MKRMHLLTALTAALVVAACGTADPTAPAIDRLEADGPVHQRAFVVDPGAPVGVDEDGDFLFCSKTTPASENAAGHAPPHLILKDDKNDRCPRGFTEVGAT